MSPRAACRLEQLGFTDVRDYSGGKASWLAAGLPVEGAVAADERVRARTRDVPAVDRSARVADARTLLDDAHLVVVTVGGVVDGVVPAPALASADGEAGVAALVQPVATVRPGTPLADLPPASADRRPVVVTTADGSLCGLLDQPG